MDKGAAKGLEGRITRGGERRGFISGRLVRGMNRQGAELAKASDEI
jgi:hypothetical protein